MGFNDILATGYQAKENPEFGARKKLIGDAVCTMSFDKILSKKGQEWIVLKGEAINCPPDEKGRETTVEPGDEISKIYDPNDNDSMQKCLDDLFTAGVEYEQGADEDETIANIKEATDGKLFYFRTWAKDKTEKDKEKYPNGPDFFQNIKILSKSKLTPENTVPVAPF